MPIFVGAVSEPFAVLAVRRASDHASVLVRLTAGRGRSRSVGEGQHVLHAGDLQHPLDGRRAA
jgi:hypothetical protein